MHSWYLEGYFEADGVLQKQPLRKLPQTLGRDKSVDCSIQGPTISRQHAVLEIRHSNLCIRDLGSRNGTFVNREQISQQTAISHGDVIHLGEVEFRVIDANHSQTISTEQDVDETCIVSMGILSQHFPSGINDLEKLIAKREVLPVYQPIILASDLSRTGFELLGRGANHDLPTSPLELFRLAESFSLEVTLSELMRDIGIEHAVAKDLKGELLINTHPGEMTDIDRLLKSISNTKLKHPHINLVLEIHEQAITDDIALLKTLQTELSKLNVKLAFDDFGVGQSRLVEMVEAKPDLIKFDRVLIANIEKADASRINLIKHLLSLANELKISTLAEGVGTEEEYFACKKLGFEYYQGFHFCRPQAADYFIEQSATQGF